MDFQKYNIKERRKKKRGKTNNLFNKWCWENWSTTCKRMKLEHYLTPYTKKKLIMDNKSKGKTETIKLLEENIGKTLSNINHSRILYDCYRAETNTRL